MNPIIVGQAKKYDTYPKFLRYLRENGIIQSTCTAVSREGAKGLKEFYKAARKEK